MYTAKIYITLRPTILDPQGKAIEHALKALGYTKIEDTRVGKVIELKISAESEEEARRISDEACRKLLSNSVTEDYTFEIFKNGEAGH